MSMDAALTITEFLLARIAEDEELARDSFYEGQSWLPEEEAVVAGDQDLDLVLMMDRKRDAQHAAHWSPTRVLAECAAKRAMVEQWDDPAFSDQGAYDAGHARAMDDAVRALAAVHADHPDYRQEWALNGTR